MNRARTRRIVYSAVLGFIVFGAWAYAVNFHDPAHRLTSAFSQGVFSFTFSLVVMSITEGTFAWLTGKRWQVPVSIAVPVATSVGCAALIHLAAHTPSIVPTLLGPAVVGTVYQTAYVLNLRRQSRGS
jgi:tellurite resistance protein TehA-like permease